MKSKVISWDRYNVIVNGLHRSIVKGTPLSFGKAAGLILFNWIWDIWLGPFAPRWMKPLRPGWNVGNVSYYYRGKIESSAVFIFYNIFKGVLSTLTR
jgi:hypothetical protein